MQSWRWRALSAIGLLAIIGAAAVACGPASRPAPAPSGQQPAASAPAPGAPAAAASVPGPGGQSTPKKGGVVVLSQNDDPPTFDVHATSFGLLTRHSDLTHNRITRYDYNGKPGSLVVSGGRYFAVGRICGS